MREHEIAGAVPRVLVTNDDGIDSEGLRLLARAARRAGYDVVIVAPDYEASGSGTAMSATQDGGRIVIGSRRLAGLEAVPAYSVPAAPAFIVFMAMREAFGRKPDIVLSGINDGPNTGRAILHSGTVGAALTAAVSGVRAAAFSLDTARDMGERDRRARMLCPRGSCARTARRRSCREPDPAPAGQGARCLGAGRG